MSQVLANLDSTLVRLCLLLSTIAALFFNTKNFYLFAQNNPCIDEKQTNSLLDTTSVLTQQWFCREIVSSHQKMKTRTWDVEGRCSWKQLLCFIFYTRMPNWSFLLFFSRTKPTSSESPHFRGELNPLHSPAELLITEDYELWQSLCLVSCVSPLLWLTGSIPTIR